MLLQNVAGAAYAAAAAVSVLGYLVTGSCNHECRAGAYVECVVDKQGKQRKLTIIHHISQKHHTRKYGHRQPYTKLIVKTIKS